MDFLFDVVLFQNCGATSLSKFHGNLIAELERISGNLMSCGMKPRIVGSFCHFPQVWLFSDIQGGPNSRKIRSSCKRQTILLNIQNAQTITNPSELRTVKVSRAPKDHSPERRRRRADSPRRHSFFLRLF